MNMQSGAAARREAIRQLMREEGPIASQAALRKALRERGWRVTQPTLSRDLRELGMARTPAGYVAPADLGATAGAVPFSPAALREEKLVQLLRTFGLSVRRAGTLVVIRTPPGGAHAVARALDEAAFDEIVGTIAGDDTIFVAASTPGAARRIADRLHRLAPLGPGAPRR
jgi:transcriptional regulator of arginine metabolism